MAEGSSLVATAVINDTDGDSDVFNSYWEASDGETTLSGPGTTINFPTSEHSISIYFTTTDNAGQSAYATTTIPGIATQAPLASISGPSTGTEDGSVSLTGVIADPDAAKDTLQQNWTVNGPGNFASSGTGGAINFPTTAPGTYAVTYTVTDDDGLSSVATTSVTVAADPAPVPSITGTTTVPEGTAVSLTAVNNDPDQSSDALNESWTATGPNNFSAGGAGTAIAFQATEQGTYSVTYTVTDDDGKTATANAAVTVTAGSAPVVSIAGGSTAVEGDTINLSGSVNDIDSWLDTFSQTWSVTGPDNFSASGSGGTLNFKAAELGAYTVKYTTTDDDGQAGTASATVNVVDPPLVAGQGNLNLLAGSKATLDLKSLLLNSESDESGTLAFSSQGAGNGTVSIDNSGVMTYLPNPDFSGSDSVTYSVSDGEGQSATGTVSVNVSPITITLTLDYPDNSPLTQLNANSPGLGAEIDVGAAETIHIDVQASGGFDLSGYKLKVSAASGSLYADASGQLPLPSDIALTGGAADVTVFLPAGTSTAVDKVVALVLKDDEATKADVEVNEDTLSLESKIAARFVQLGHDGAVGLIKAKGLDQAFQTITGDLQALRDGQYANSPDQKIAIDNFISTFSDIEDNLAGFIIDSIEKQPMLAAKFIIPDNNGFAPDIKLAEGADGGGIGVTIDRAYLGSITNWDSFKKLMADPGSGAKLTTLVSDFEMPGRFIQGAHLQTFAQISANSTLLTSVGVNFSQDATDSKKFTTTYDTQIKLQSKSRLAVFSQSFDAAGKPTTQFSYGLTF